MESRIPLFCSVREKGAGVSVNGRVAVRTRFGLIRIVSHSQKRSIDMDNISINHQRRSRTVGVSHHEEPYRSAATLRAVVTVAWQS